jgi:hypothetical protein
VAINSNPLASKHLRRRKIKNPDYFFQGEGEQQKTVDLSPYLATIFMGSKSG